MSQGSDVDAASLAADVAKKSGLVWIAYGGAVRPAWHEWATDAVCVVAGGGEQPLPGLADQTSVVVVLRAKSTRHVIGAVRADVDLLSPEHPHWDEVTAALRAGRLNLVDGAHAAERWARDAVVARLVPRELTAVPPPVHPAVTPRGRRATRLS